MILFLVAIICCKISCKIIEQKNDYLKLMLDKDANDLSFTTEVFIGNPLQRQILMIDTGSPYLLVKGQDCQNCTQARLPFYSKSASKTFKNIDCKRYPIKCHNLCPRKSGMGQQCNFREAYGSKNFQIIYSGVVGNDQIRFTDSKQADKTNIQQAYRNEYLVAVIGKQSESENKDYDNGLMGLSPQKEDSVMYDWFRLNNLQHSRMKLGLCLQSKRGYMEWGNFSSQGNSTILYDYRSGSYSILVDSIVINGQSLLGLVEMLTSRIIIDSGSSVCSFPQQQHNKIVQVLNAKCTSINTCQPIDYSTNIYNRGSNRKHYCYGFTIFTYFSFDQFLDEEYPPIQIKLNGTFYNLKPSKYLRLANEDNAGYKAVCLNIMSNTQRLYVLGLPWMVDKKITFNLDPSHSTVTIVDDYQCFDLLEQLQIKLYKGWLGYLLISLLFLFITCKGRVYSKIRRQNTKNHNSQIEFVGMESFNK